jgi:hypothetical protein
MTESDHTIYLIYAGTGNDGGFGDHAGVSWSSSPIKIDGQTVWFENQAEAEAIVEELNHASSNVFNMQAKYENYNGMFPLEYEARKITIPSNKPATSENFQKIFTSESMRWDDPVLDSE